MEHRNDPYFNEVKRTICVSLGLDPERPPLTLTDNQVSQVLGVKTSTLSVWRSVGRYNLPFTKSGRLVRYPLDSLVAFYLNHTFRQTDVM